MRLEKTTIEVTTSGETDIEDLSSEVDAFVASTGVEEGWLLISVAGSTAAITTIEFETGAVRDLHRAFERLAPRDGEYEHNLRWGDGNGFSHVRAALLGPSLTLPVSNGRAERGTWQQIVLCDFDNRPRTRQIQLRVMAP